MLKRYVGCLFILCLLINVAFAAKVIVGVNAVYKPLEFLDKKGNIVGFNPDLISIILKNEGYEFEFKDMDFDALLPSLETGAIDIIASTFTITKERAKKVDFTDVTLVGGISIVYNKKNINKASELSDLRGKKLGCESGTTGCDKILKIDPNAIVFNNTIDLLMSLEAGKIDASVSDTIIVADYIKNKKNTDLALVGKQVDVEDYAFAVKKGANKQLFNSVNKALKDMNKNKELKRLQNKWL